MSDFAETRSDLAYAALEHMIVTLRLKPGARVNERDLMDACQLGRSPVREAVQRLAWLGLMEIRPRSGLVITELKPAELVQILEARRQLAPLAARLVAANLAPPARRTLIDCAKAMTECQVTGDFEGFLEAEREFNLVIEAQCPNRFLTKALAPLMIHSRRFWFAAASADRLDRTAQLHVTVIRAILKEDGEVAENAMLRLIDGMSDMTQAG